METFLFVCFSLMFFFSPDHFNIDRRPVLRPFSVAADAVDLNKRRICVVCVSVSSAGSILMAETKAQRRQTDLRLGPSTPQRQSSTSKRQTANSERDRRLIVFSSFFFFNFFLCVCVSLPANRDGVARRRWRRQHKPTPPPQKKNRRKSRKRKRRKWGEQERTKRRSSFVSAFSRSWWPAIVACLPSRRDARIDCLPTAVSKWIFSFYRISRNCC